MSSIVRRQHLRDVAGFSAFVVAFYFGYRYGMSFSQAAASPFWFPDSILLCALLMSPPRRWWIFILAPLPIRLFSEVAAGIPYWFLLATFALDSAKGLFDGTGSALVYRQSRPSQNGAGVRALPSDCQFSWFPPPRPLAAPPLRAFSTTTIGWRGGNGFWAMRWPS